MGVVRFTRELKHAGSCVLNVGLASFMTARLAPLVLGRQLPVGLVQREVRGEAEAAPTIEGARAIACDEENIMI
jgi:hypothetical protein